MNKARSQFEPFELKVTRMPAAKPNFKMPVAKAKTKANKPVACFRPVSKPHEDYERIADAKFNEFMELTTSTYFMAFPEDRSLGLPFVDMLKITLPKMKEVLGEGMIGDPCRFAAVLGKCILMRLQEENRLK